MFCILFMSGILFIGLPSAWLIVYLPNGLSACLPLACLSVCLPACLTSCLACPPSCLPTNLLSYKPACLLPCLTSQPACLPSLQASLPTSLPFHLIACLYQIPPYQPACLFICLFNNIWRSLHSHYFLSPLYIRSRTRYTSTCESIKIACLCVSKN